LEQLELEYTKHETIAEAGLTSYVKNNKGVANMTISLDPKILNLNTLDTWWYLLIPIK
jgi:hypothetical protein